MQGVEGEAAVVGEDVEDPGVAGEGADDGAVLALVEEESGFLAFEEVDFVGEAVVVYALDGVGWFAFDDVVVSAEPFEFTEGGAVAEDDGVGVVELLQGVGDEWQMAVHAGGVALDDHGVGEAVDDEAGQSVGFAVDESPGVGDGGVVDGGAHGVCFAEPALEEGGVGFFVAGGDEPDGDEGVGIEYPGADEVAVVGVEFDGVAGGEVAGYGFEFVAEYPEVSFADAVVFFGLEVEGLHGCWVNCWRVGLFLMFSVMCGKIGSISRSKMERWKMIGEKCVSGRLLRWLVLLMGVVVVLGGVSGCGEFRSAGRLDVPKGAAVSGEEYLALYREVAAGAPWVRSMDGYADVWVSTPQRKNRLYCNVRLDRGRASRLMVSAGFLNWPVADLYADSDSLMVHDLLSERFFAGRNSAVNVEKILGMRVDYGLLSEVLLGLVSLPDPPDGAGSVQAGDGMVLFSMPVPDGSREVVVDRERRMLMGLVLRDVAGRKRLEVHFRNPEQVGVGERLVWVPRQIEMLLYRSGEETAQHQLVVAYDERTFNRMSGSLRPVWPKDARVISIDDVARLMY